MRTLFISIGFGTVLALTLTASAAGPAATDPVAASFTRMLEHAPVTTAPASPATREDDPLYTRLAAVLWARQPTQCAFVTGDIAAADRRSVAQ